MARSMQRRQKQLERKRKRQMERQRELRRAKSRGLARLMADAAAHPILHSCYQLECIADYGMGNVLLSRKLPDGRIAMALFLVDTYCCGVKHARAELMSPFAYDELLEELRESGAFVAIPPECLRKFVEGAVAFAAKYGLKPDREYARACPLFGDLDPKRCDTVWEYGDEGKPVYIVGPYDSPERQTEIITTVTDTAGPENFRVIIPVHGNRWLADKLMLDEDRYRGLYH